MATYRACGVCLSCQLGRYQCCSSPVKEDDRQELENKHGHPWRSRYEPGCQCCATMSRLGLWPEFDRHHAPIPIS